MKHNRITHRIDIVDGHITCEKIDIPGPDYRGLARQCGWVVAGVGIWMFILFAGLVWGVVLVEAIARFLP